MIGELRSHMPCNATKKKKSWSFGEKSTKLIALKKESINKLFFKKEYLLLCCVCVCVCAHMCACMHAQRQTKLTNFFFFQNNRRGEGESIKLEIHNGSLWRFNLSSEGKAQETRSLLEGNGSCRLRHVMCASFCF